MNAKFRRRKSWVTLLACLAAAGEVTAQVGAQDSAAEAVENAAPAAPAEAPAAPAAAPEARASATGLRWRGLPPIRTSGSVSYDLRANHGQDEPSSLSHLVTTSLSAYSYIYQPWFATVNGTLALTVGRSRGGIDNGVLGGVDNGISSGINDATSGERFVTGNARVDFFPRSRFPGEIHVDRSDSRIDSGLASTVAFQTQNIGFSQRYRPPNSAYTLSGKYDRREQFGNGFRDTQDTLSGDFGTRWKHHEVGVDASLSQARRKASDERTRFRSLVGRHTYVPGSDLSINSTVNLTQTQEQGLAFGESDLSVLQATSVGIWRKDAKLSLTGSARALLLRDAETDNELDTVGGTVGATYELTKNARLSATGGADMSNSNGRNVSGLNGSVGASYQGDSIEYKGIRYDWFTNGNLGASRAGDSTQATLTAQLGHALNRTWQTTSASSLALNAAQTVTASENRSSISEPEDDPFLSSRSLLHSLGATFTTGGDNRTAYARATYSDAKELGGDNSRFQIFNFQVSGNFQFDRNRSLTGDFTWQRTTQRSGDTRLPGEVGLFLGERSTSRGASGEITYTHLRAFGIPRLRFTSRLKLAQDVLDQPGTFATIADRETRLWENRLEWSAGLFETQLIFRISEVDGRRRESLMWRLQRNFGGW